MFIAYWPVLGFVVGLVLVAVFTVLALASRVCRTRHETLPERPLQSYLPETVSPIVKGLCLGFRFVSSWFRICLENLNFILCMPDAIIPLQSPPSTYSTHL